MRKAIILFCLIIGFNTNSLAQCSVNSFIEDNYMLDAQILALREIRSDSQDPDYDNPFIPEARITPYLEKLSAIYENPSSIPIIDSIFAELQIHVNIDLWEPIGYNGISFNVNTNISWVQTLKDTGMSGFAPLDNFFANYQMHLTNFWDLPGLGITVFFISTDFEFLNTYALEEELGSIQDILDTNAACNEDCPAWLNYTGVPYLVYSEGNKAYFAEACDISATNNRFTFKVAGGDCLAGCVAEINWVVDVSEDCSTVVLNVSERSPKKFSISPNPASYKIQIHGVTYEINSTLIYSVTGEIVYSAISSSETIDISNLNSGLYFLEVTSSEGNKQTQKFIKK